MNREALRQPGLAYTYGRSTACHTERTTTTLEGHPLRFPDWLQSHVFPAIHFTGHSISYRLRVDRKWHASARIHPVQYNELRDQLLETSTCRSVGGMCRELARIPFEPYAPVRRQLLNILRAVNRARK